MGLTTEEALRNMLARADTPAVRSFVRAVTQGETLGVVGESVSLDDGRRAADISALRALSLIRKHCGTLDAIATVPRMTVYVRSAPGFTMQSEVADGASDVLVAVLDHETDAIR